MRRSTSIAFLALALFLAPLYVSAQVYPVGYAGGKFPRATTLPSGFVVPIASITAALAAGGNPIAGTTFTAATSVLTPLINNATGFSLQYNGTSYLTLGASSLLLGNAPLIRTPRVVTGNATLNSYDTLVLLNYSGAVSMTITLPSAPPDGTPITFIGLGSSNFNTSISRGGSDTIVTSSATSIDMSLQNQNATFIYDAARTRWWIAGLQHKIVWYKWTSASANDYLQPASGGGVLGTAQPILNAGGVVVTDRICAFARTTPASNQTVKVRTTSNTFGSASDLTNNLTVTLTTSGSTACSNQIINLTSNASFGNYWVLQATTSIATEMEVFVDIYTL